MGKKKAAVIEIPLGRRLLLMDGCELLLLEGGPYIEQADFEQAVVEAIREHEIEEGDDLSLHILDVDADGISVSDFSGEFMDQMRAIAFEEEDPEPGANEGTEEN